MQYLCNKHGLDQFYPTDPGERAMVDSAMFYLIGTLYPLVARATYPTLGFPQYPGEVATSDADDELKAQAQQDAEAALAEPLEAYRAFFLDGRTFIGGDAPSIADIRLAASLEFLRAIDYDVPGLGGGVHDRGRGRARRRLLRAGGRRARLRRVGAELLAGGAAGAVVAIVDRAAASVGDRPVTAEVLADGDARARRRPDRRSTTSASSRGLRGSFRPRGGRARARSVRSPSHTRRPSSGRARP